MALCQLVLSGAVLTSGVNHARPVGLFLLCIGDDPPLISDSPVKPFYKASLTDKIYFGKTNRKSSTSKVAKISSRILSISFESIFQGTCFFAFPSPVSAP